MLSGVRGYIKMKFVTATDANGSYGFGSVTDGEWNLCVHIAQFESSEALMEGVHVEMRGKIKQDPSIFFFLMRSSVFVY